MANQSNFSQLIPQDAWGQFLYGLRSLWRAILWIYDFKPYGIIGAILAIYTCLFIGFLIIGWHILAPTIPTIAAELQQLLPSSAILQRLIVFLGWFLWFLTIPLLLVFSCIMLFAVGKLVTFPLLEKLALQVISSIASQQQQEPRLPMLQYIFFHCKENMFNILIVLLLYFPMLILSFIPIAGNLISFTFGSLMIAHEMIGLPLCLNYIPYQQRWQFIWQHKWISLGFGLGVLCFFTIPGLHLLFLPIATVGGVLIYTDLQQ